ncbi:uncharacterized protein EDB93DRAFT_145014 [Suillus bovinus]|uniref:uncharacterized protein n=1 Tax=Suillus bovinus TaxID=48563 RepID=UPI001B870ED7|nr:uncharacterized protein EDB93DRAFT_145014 [Suillus bovinus]KAG2129042.1 hypothetical protein EDB93DRAFT_145014 [Suillus bovinus]
MHQASLFTAAMICPTSHSFFFFQCDRGVKFADHIRINNMMPSDFEAAILVQSAILITTEGSCTKLRGRHDFSNEHNRNNRPFLFCQRDRGVKFADSIRINTMIPSDFREDVILVHSATDFSNEQNLRLHV